MSDDPAQTVGTDFLHLVAEYAGFAAIGVGVLYTVGLLVVNADLSRYGLVSMGLARPEYVLTGAMWAFLMLFTYSVFSVIVATIRHVIWNLDSLGARIFYSLLALSTPGFFIMVVFMIAGHSNMGLSPQKLLWITEGILISASSILLASGPVRVELKRLFGEQVPQATDAVILDSPWKRSVFELGPQVVLVLAGLAFYASWTFPYISKDWGGGARPTVILYLNERPPSGRLGALADGMTIGPAPCIQETEQAVIIELQSPNLFPVSNQQEHPVALAIDRHLIKYILYDSKR
ncbi:MAG: hypothetical protein WA993_17570 [Candidatus Binatus sp.]|uniref:hypothetical protein n=1 Tax=Candidatus Binatus sp. TaxID=2811406 RepID=UPI003CB7CB00